MTDENEAFEQMALKQGHWQHPGGNRKRQIAHMDMHSHPAEFIHLHRNDVIEEVAQNIEKCTLAFGKDTIQSFTAYVRGMKK